MTWRFFKNDPDQAWAHEAMVKAISDNRTVTIPYLWQSRKVPLRYAAIHHGYFHYTLSKAKDERAVEPLVDIVRNEMADVSDTRYLFEVQLGLVKIGTRATDALTHFEGPEVEGIMLDVVETAVERGTDVWALKYAAEWLVKRSNREVIDHLKHGLTMDWGYQVLSGTRNPYYLKEIEKIPNDLQLGFSMTKWWVTEK